MNTGTYLDEHQILTLAMHELLRRNEEEKNRQSGPIKDYRLDMFDKQISELHEMLLQVEKEAKAEERDSAQDTSAGEQFELFKTYFELRLASCEKSRKALLSREAVLPPETFTRLKAAWNTRMTAFSEVVITAKYGVITQEIIDMLRLELEQEA
jgi:hypothetical protein